MTQPGIINAIDFESTTRDIPGSNENVGLVRECELRDKRSQRYVTNWYQGKGATAIVVNPEKLNTDEDSNK